MGSSGALSWRELDPVKLICCTFPVPEATIADSETAWVMFFVMGCCYGLFPVLPVKLVWSLEQIFGVHLGRLKTRNLASRDHQNCGD